MDSENVKYFFSIFPFFFIFQYKNLSPFDSLSSKKIFADSKTKSVSSILCFMLLLLLVLAPVKGSPHPLPHESWTFAKECIGRMLLLPVATNDIAS